MSILCLIKQIKPKYEINYLGRRSCEIPNFWKRKSDLKSAPSKYGACEILLRLES